jgi:hypothetical protein
MSLRRDSPGRTLATFDNAERKEFGQVGQVRRKHAVQSVAALPCWLEAKLRDI